MNTRYLFWIFIFLISILRISAASQFGLTVDEAHYVLYGKFIDWSYFDHPPLIGWTHWIFHFLPLDHLIRARLPAVLISILSSQLIFNFLISKKISEKNAVFATIALNLTPMFNTISIVLLPDSFLMPLTILIITTIEKIIHQSSLKNWMLLGLFLGISGISKYTAVLYIVALIIIFIYKNQFKELLKTNLWIGVIIALFLISPVLYWNIKNNWISFQYQANHVLTLNTSFFKNLTISFAIQLLSWGIAPFIISFVGYFQLMKPLIKSLKKQNSFLISFIFLTVFLMFFIYVAFSEVLLPHWMLIFFILMIPIAYSHFLENSLYLKQLIAGTFFSAVLSLILLFEITFKIFPGQSTASMYEGVLGWDQILSEANNYLDKIPNQKKALAVMNWTLGSRAMYYNNKNSELFVIDNRFDQFDIWNPQSSIGYDLLLLIEANKKEENLPHLNCSEISQIGEFQTTLKDVPVNHFLYYHCANFLGYK